MAARAGRVTHPRAFPITFDRTCSSADSVEVGARHAAIPQKTPPLNEGGRRRVAKLRDPIGTERSSRLFQPAR